LSTVDPLEALQRLRETHNRTRPKRDQVARLEAPIVQIRHGRGRGAYITRWITTHGGKVLEHEEETRGIPALSRLLRETIRRDDHAQIVHHVRATSANVAGVRGPKTMSQTIREPDERRRREAAEGMPAPWKLDREPEVFA
jgi:hypothetical protein